MIIFLKIFFCFCFVLAANAKLLKTPFYSAQFKEFGLSENFMRLIGVLELFAGIGLFIRPAAFLSAMTLAAIMCGAVFCHLRAGHPYVKYAPALYFIPGLLYIGWREWG